MKLYYNIVVLISFVVKAKALICFECTNAPSNRACNSGFNGGLRNCPLNALACENLVRTRNGRTLYTKRCKQPEACRNNIKRNNNGGRCCCSGEDLCNRAALPCLSSQRLRKRQNPKTSRRPLTCLPPKNPSNGGTTCESEPLLNGRYLLQSTCRYFCNEGYTRVGQAITTCKYVDGNTRAAKFSPLPAGCRRRACQRINTIENGNVICSKDNRLGSSCEFSCEGGYSLYPSDVVQTECLSNKKWSEPIPCCLEICKPNPIDLLLILDSSMKEKNWKLVKQFIIRFISNLNIQRDAVNVGVFRYNSKVDKRSQIFLNDFANDKDGLMDAVEKMPHNGEGTRTGNALRYARTTMFNTRNGDRPNAPNVILLVTEGKGEDGSVVFSESKALWNQGVISYAIAVMTGEKSLDWLQLSAIAGSVDQIIFLERGYEELLETLASSLGQPDCKPKSCPGTFL